MNEFFTWLGQVIVYGGGSIGIAYLTFQWLGKKWIENRFAERLQKAQHQQNLELQRLRVEIDSLLSGTIRLQEREFDAVSEIWSTLLECQTMLGRLVSIFQQYPDLDGISEDRLDEFLSDPTDLSEADKNEIRAAAKKTEKHQEIIHYHRMFEAKKAIANLYQTFQRESIFLPEPIQKLVKQYVDQVHDARISKEIGFDTKDYKMQNDSWRKLRNEIEPLKDKVQTAISDRIISHTQSRSDAS